MENDRRELGSNKAEKVVVESIGSRGEYKQMGIFVKAKGPITAGTEMTFTYGKSYFGICNPTNVEPWMLQQEEDKDASTLEKETPEKTKSHTWKDSNTKSTGIRKGKKAKAPRMRQIKLTEMKSQEYQDIIRVIS